MDFYADDATLVIKPGLSVTGKPRIRQAFLAIAEHFQHQLVVRQGRMELIPGGDTVLVIMESLLSYPENGGTTEVTRRATYVFRESQPGKWACVIDNSYGTGLLDHILIG